MECCVRTDADKKGGHLARKGRKLLLRESAQCQDADEKKFQDITRHKFFNTNNLWVDPRRSRRPSPRGGLLPLPVIKNGKTVDPRDPIKVLQLEAMGSAIECFEGAQARAPAPVKTTGDGVNVDAYEVTEDHRS